MGWVSAVTWMLLAVAVAVLAVATLVSAGRLPAWLPPLRSQRRRDRGAALEPPGTSGIEWFQQRVSTEQIREHAHGRHEAQDR